MAKLTSSLFVPYRKVNGNFEFYLQQRGPKAPTYPNLFGMFGGSVEKGETPLEGFLRETKEELNYVPENYRFFGSYEFPDVTRHIFVQEVRQDFANKVTVLEGDYGKFISSLEITGNEKIVDVAREILNDLTKKLTESPNQ